LRPFFAWTTVQVGPAAFTRRVRVASPGGSSSQSAGTRRIWPSAERTVRSLGPGATIRFWSGILDLVSAHDVKNGKDSAVVRRPASVVADLGRILGLPDHCRTSYSKSGAGEVDHVDPIKYLVTYGLRPGVFSG
jgi:hypothetical protein